MDNFSMQNTGPRHIRTGGDPRPFPDFTALRDEMSKQSHPARPDIHWDRVEQLSLALFEKNGIELQTGAWYTLARSHLARVSGMNEGLGIIAAMLGHQWAQFWPQASHARSEILSGLFQRLQKVFRTLSPGPADVPDLVLAEKRLLEIKAILRRQALGHACQIDPLMQLIRSAISRHENSPLPEEVTADESGPEQVQAESDEVTEQASRLVYVIQKKPEIGVQVTEAAQRPLKRWPAFIAGMVTALLLSAVTALGWQVLHRPDEVTKAMAASVAWLPAAMTEPQIESFRKTKRNLDNSRMWLPRISGQLNWIMSLAPGWRLRYGQGLVAQAQALWPDKPETKTLVQRWEQYQAGRTLPASQLNGWHEGMTQLRALSAQLDALDRQKGKYLTGSELKTIVWRITSSFASAVPVEEQLRQLTAAQGATGTNAEPAARHLDSLIHVLEQLSVQQNAGPPDISAPEALSQSSN